MPNRYQYHSNVDHNPPQKGMEDANLFHQLNNLQSNRSEEVPCHGRLDGGHTHPQRALGPWQIVA